MKKEFNHIASNEKEMQHLIALAKQRGLKRKQNAYWVEIWENSNEKHVLHRDF